MQFYPKLIDTNNDNLLSYHKSTTKVVCVGRNYIEHAKELNNPIPETPLLFNKSTNSLVDLTNYLTIPKHLGECHHELEIAVLIGENINNQSGFNDIERCIQGIGLGLDLTLRDLQKQLKSKGHPWERAKSFDGSCPVTPFFSKKHFEDLTDIDFLLIKNGEVVQQGSSREMIFNILELIQNISQSFSLYPGDIILTGTPKGVASLNLGDKISLSLNNQNIAQAIIA